jgi:hypothetical protein
LLPAERSRQQLATDLLDQFAPEPANGAVGGPVDETACDPVDETTGGPADETAGEADNPAAPERAGAAEAEPRDEAFGKPRDETATASADGSDPSTETAGPHRDICGRSFENQPMNFEFSAGRHQYAPVAKKKT